MGKKRRLLHSKKFALKHDNHPRMKLLNKTTETLTEATPPETTTTLNLQAIADEIMAEDPIVEERPPVPKPKALKTTTKKTQKAAASAPPKTTTKTTTTKKSPAKKTTTTRKRSTRTKTKTAPA